MAECKYSTSIEPGPQIPSYAVRLRLFEVCLTLAKHLLSALLVLVVLAAPADAHQGGPDQTLSASPFATAAPAEAGHHDGERCAQATAGLHCSWFGCAQCAEMNEPPFPSLRSGGQLRVTGATRLGSIPSRPVLQPPILPASA
jgi:hypothetical protein